ncbi:MAG: FAD-dependent oxidoreductase [Telmatospirillum sp.]|nr:FAD-dependent oxidoreductase [Telmatospirillum sp.]
MGFVYPQYEFRPSADSAAAQPVRHAVVVIGAGPVGLATAIDLAQSGRRVVLLDDDTSVSHGSRGLCYAKRTLEIFDRLGCAAPIVAKGVTWQVGKVFHGPKQIYAFDLLPEGGHRFPAFVNLQQYWLEKFLVDRALSLPNLDLRFASRVSALEPHADHVGLDVETPAGKYRIEAEWVVACDGARSPARKMLGLDFKGRVFEDRFLIADVRMQAEFPTERWFWFEPPFHEGESTLLHKQPDDLWRIDFQLGANADPQTEKEPARVIPRVQAMLGPDVAFELEWVSVYTFQCRRLERLRHGRVLFAGDAAHQVSPFGARGANSGVQDADNLVWKLCAVLDGHAPAALLDSYDAERGAAADENIGHSTRATDFITPKNAAARLFRDAVLELAPHHAFARRLVNSGRLSQATHYSASPLSTPDIDVFKGGPAPGSPALDAPLKDGWLLDLLKGGFTLLAFGETAPELPDLPIAIAAISEADDPQRLAHQRYDAAPGTVYLFRPDQYVCCRLKRFDATAIRSAYARACGKEM